MKHALNEQETTQAAQKLSTLRNELKHVLFGQDALVDNLVTGLLARGHVLLEGLPGLGKTELVKGLGKAVELQVRRVQFTPDLLPGDITGNPLLQEESGKRSFIFQRGPIFTNLLLADEINRASPKTQSALLEAMQERRVTVMGETHELPAPFFVLATQNPIELEGTYPLPEAQLDRFLFKLDVYRADARVTERIVREREMNIEPQVCKVLTRDELLSLMELARRVFLPDALANYIARLVDATHRGNAKASQGVKYGAGPRAALGLASAARARALMEARPHASFEDVKAVAVPVLAHRIILDYSAKIQGGTSTEVVQALCGEVPVLDKAVAPTLSANGGGAQ